MEKQSFDACRTNLRAQLDVIVIELHNIGRAIENLQDPPIGLAKSLRLLGDSASNLNTVICKTD